MKFFELSLTQTLSSAGIVQNVECNVLNRFTEVEILTSAKRLRLRCAKFGMHTMVQESSWPLHDIRTSLAPTWDSVLERCARRFQQREWIFSGREVILKYPHSVLARLKINPPVQVQKYQIILQYGLFSRCGILLDDLKYNSTSKHR
jgi:hypothetical protein